MEAWGSSSGQPLGIDFDNQGVAFVCDAAHQAIFRILRVEREGAFAHQIDPYVKEYEQSQFLGPNSLCLSRQTGMLYFTDSGPLGETSLQNPRGSVFAISPSTQLLIPLCLNTLAHPCGVALSPDEKNIYVAETAMNRILRFTQHPPQVFHCSVFCQLSGRFGPTALAVSAAGDLYVAHFDFADNVDTGRVVVLNPEGEVKGVISIPGPEITGLCISPDQRYLVVAERFKRPTQLFARSWRHPSRVLRHLRMRFGTVSELLRPPPGLETFRAQEAGPREFEGKDCEMWPSDCSTTDTDSTSRCFQEDAASPQGMIVDSFEGPTPCTLQLHSMLEESAPRDDCPSIGSAAHSLGLCKPCDFKCRSSCRFGYECMFCHICGPAESRQWKRHRKSFWRQARACARNAASAQEGTSATPDSTSNAVPLCLQTALSLQ
ncbi:unnamed protein product [Effrenium voratum]|uniref:SMP-30/Gluconolactonase/LRE-like region domain-containing protein n=1 Tax=Effrenium voratum TaxID=2562239 RepID=A0AA36MS79_9DINO|nr:unnamed protein product [Effrenium voratum]